MIDHKPLPVQPVNSCRDGIPDGGGIFFRDDLPFDHGIPDGLAAGMAVGHHTGSPRNAVMASSARRCGTILYFGEK